MPRIITPAELRAPVPADIEIAQAAVNVPIADVAAELGLESDDIDPHGHLKAKVHLNVRDKLAAVADGNYGVLRAHALVCLRTQSLAPPARGTQPSKPGAQ